MSSIDHRQNSATEEQQKVNTNPLPLQGIVTQHASPEQLPFPTNSVLSGDSPQAPGYQMSVTPARTRQLNDPISSSPEPVSDPGLSSTRSLIAPDPAVTRELTEIQTGALTTLSQKRTAIRQPVLIRGMVKRSSSLPPPKGRRMVVHVAVTAVLALIVFSALFAVLPVGGGNHNSIFKLITGGANGSGGMNIINTKNNNTGLISQQAATATAVTQDGFDQGSQTYAGVPTAPPDAGNGSTSGSGGATSGSPGKSGAPVGDNNLLRFFWGQCTYWANYRYGYLTGYHVPWLGNAADWLGGAYNYRWKVSYSKPPVPSIIVLQPGVQGAGGYGHVAVVEGINADGSVRTTNFNWAGYFGIETVVNFFPGPGVSFVSYPG